MLKIAIAVLFSVLPAREILAADVPAAGHSCAQNCGKASPENYRECVDIYRGEYSYDGTKALCADWVKDIDFTTENMAKCRGLFAGSYSPAGAASLCVQRIDKGFSFINNPNFDRCHEIFLSGYNSASAADICIGETAQFSFIDNPTFDLCVDKHVFDYSKYNAAFLCEAEQQGR